MFKDAKIPIDEQSLESNKEFYVGDLNLFQDQEMLAELNDEGTPEKTTEVFESDEAMLERNLVSRDEDKPTDSGEDFLDNEQEQQRKQPYTLTAKVKELISGVRANQSNMDDDLDEIMIKITLQRISRLKK